MQANISIRVDRRPDFFGLLRQRGQYFTYLAECNGQIIGSASISSMSVFILRKVETAFYLSDFKVHPDFRHSTVAARLGKRIIQKLQELQAEFLFCAIASGNVAVAPFMQGRYLFPTGCNAGTFKVLQIVPTPHKIINKVYQLSESSKTSGIEGLLAQTMSQFQMAQNPKDYIFGNCRIITATHQNELVAVMTLIDTEEWKQEVLLKLGGFLKLILILGNTFSKIVPVIRFPKLNEPIRLLYIRSFACKPGHEKALKLLINKARNIAFEEKFHFLSIGLHEKNPYLKLFSTPFHFTLESNMYFGMLDKKSGKN